MSGEIERTVTVITEDVSSNGVPALSVTLTLHVPAPTGVRMPLALSEGSSAIVAMSPAVASVPSSFFYSTTDHV